MVRLPRWLRESATRVCSGVSSTVAHACRASGFFSLKWVWRGLRWFGEPAKAANTWRPKAKVTLEGVLPFATRVMPNDVWNLVSSASLFGGMPQLAVLFAPTASAALLKPAASSASAPEQISGPSLPAGMERLPSPSVRETEPQGKAAPSAQAAQPARNEDTYLADIAAAFGLGGPTRGAASAPGEAAPDPRSSGG